MNCLNKLYHFISEYYNGQKRKFQPSCYNLLSIYITFFSRKNINFKSCVRQDYCRGLFNKYTCNTLYLHFNPQLHVLMRYKQTNVQLSIPFGLLYFLSKKTQTLWIKQQTTAKIMHHMWYNWGVRTATGQHNTLMHDIT